MRFTKESSTKRAKTDLAERLEIGQDAVAEISLTEKEFSDMSLGAPVEGEMSAQMIASGWWIELEVAGVTYEYRGDKYQLRLYDFQGTNYVIES